MIFLNSQILFLALISLISVFCQTLTHEIIKSGNFECSSKNDCSVKYENLNLQKYQSIIVEVELTMPSSFQKGSIFQIQTSEGSQFIDQNTNLLAKNRLYYQLEKLLFKNSNFLNLNFISTDKDSSINYNLQIKGIYNDNNIIFNNLPCPFNCGNNSNNHCEPLYGICECHKGLFGDDCGINGINIQQLMDKDDDFNKYTIEQNGSQLFYMMNANSSLKDKQLKINAYVNEFLNIAEYTGLNKLQLKSTQTATPYIYEKYNSYKYSLSNVPDHESFVLIFQNTGQTVVRLEVQFQFKGQNYSSEDIVSLSNTYGVVIITFIIMISLVFMVLVFLTIKYIVAQYKSKKISKIQIEQKNMQIDSKMPVQKYETVIQKYPNVKECNECSVCLEEFKNQDDVRLTLCFHIFHSECFNLWANSSKNTLCPVCRRSLQEGEEEVFDYKLKMQASQRIASTQNTQKQTEEQNQSINKQLNSQKNNDIENQIQNPVSCHCNSTQNMEEKPIQINTETNDKVQINNEQIIVIQIQDIENQEQSNSKNTQEC